MPPRRRTGMTDEHKAALAAGRAEGLAVRRYLEALETSKAPRGRRVSEDTIQKQLGEIETKLATSDPLQRLHLAQQKKDLQARLVRTSDSGTDITELQETFIKSAADYGARKGIDYTTWRESGVPAEVLKKAGISRGRG